MYTRCPHCRTAFSITSAQLSAAGGRVRCGRCSGLFSALDGLVDDAAELTGKAPGLRAGSHPSAPPGPAFLRAENDIDTSFIPSVDAALRAPAPVVAPPAPAGRAAPARLLWGLGSLVLLGGLLAQLTFYQLDGLSQHQPLRPWLAAFCGLADCELPLRRQPAALRLLQGTVQRRATEAGALDVTVTLVNEDDDTLAFPQVALTFSDLQGTVVAGRRFRPEEYLPADTSPAAGLAPGRPLTIEFTIVDPGARAVSYNFELL
ncbi:MAG TPA: DUF3426 domain-containing protein [Gammaproteobacteria bacterium]|nr:DUF3426 domain-containing protein [Gammaproteobacteria bacterium]